MKTKRILITVEYKGTNYFGWQKNGELNTISGALESAFNRLIGGDIRIYGSGRTDAGVHAIEQTAHLDIPFDFMPTKKIPETVNEFLPEDIRVKTAKEVSDKFHARYNVKTKTYLYKIYTGAVSSPLRAGLYAFVPVAPDYEKMRAAAAVFVGKHNFSAFCTAGGDSESFDREIVSFDVIKGKGEFYFYVCGKGFLYNMVRYLVGTVIKAGKNKITPEQIASALSTGDKSFVGEKMPADGLYLYKVEY